MFEKLKQLKQLKDLQSSLQKERVEVEKRGTRVVVNGKMEVEEIQLNPELSKEEQENVLRDSINEAMKKIQMAAMQKIPQLKGFDFNK